MGEVGQKMINQWTRLLTIPLSAMQAFGIYLVMRSQGYVDDLSAFRVVNLVFVLTGGTMLLMWIAELISQHGFGGKRGGGISLVITAGILSSLPVSITEAFANVNTSNFLRLFWISLAVETVLFLLLAGIVYVYYIAGRKIIKIHKKLIRYLLYLVYIGFVLVIPAFIIYVNNFDNQFTQDFLTWWRSYSTRLEDVEVRLGFYVGLAIQLIVLITFFNESYRKIEIKFINRIRSSNVKGLENESYLPIKPLAVGVMPIIFSSSLLLMPQVINYFFGPRIEDNWPQVGEILRYAAEGWLNQLNSPYYYFLNFILIILFSLFFITVIMDPEDVANSLRHRKTFIPGVRPGQETVDYISKVIFRVTFWGGMFIALLSTLPFILGIYEADVSSGIENFVGGGVSILIAVSTLLMIKMQVDAIVLTKNYEQFEEI
jgi:preprotein translocase subunit SecY